jgi:hypothetical protein
MKTLYDVLGALPDDDAEELRSAFRKAVKGTHPDVKPGDAAAALRFREIVRANEILSDRDQRAAYDHLLDLARQEQEQESKRATAAKVHKVASGVMAIAGAAATTVAGYLLFMHMSAASVAPLKPTMIAIDRIKLMPVSAKPAELAVVTPEPTAATAADAADVETVASLPEKAAHATTIAQLGTADETDDGARASCASPGDGCNAEALADAPVVTSAAAAPATPGANDAKFYHDRGMASYRKGDLTAAVTDLDLAIQLDPKFSDAYLDRGLVLYQQRKFDRAFADVASAKRISKMNRAVMDAMARKQPLRPLKLEPPKLTRVSQRHTSLTD